MTQARPWQDLAAITSLLIRGPVGLVFSLCLIASAAFAAPPSIHGTTTTQNGTVPLVGVEVIATRLLPGGRVISVASDDRGRFELRGLEAGRRR